MEKTTFEKVKNLTTEDYFDNNSFSIDAFKKKYAQPGETYVQAIKRVCDYVASVEETKESRKYWSDRWFDEIFNDWWHPAGSIMQGAASGKNVSMANCTTTSLGLGDDENEWDNLESIYKNTMYTVAKSAAYRQGLGVDFSRLRPSNSDIYNSANKSAGVTHWMKAVDGIGYQVGQSGRVPAMLFSLSCTHPDLLEFIDVKKDYTKIQNANISVQLTNDFYEACKNDSNWNMIFEIPKTVKGSKIYVDVHSIDMECKQDEHGKWYKIAKSDRAGEKIERTEKARKILELIAKGMHSYAEPGIQNIDIAKKYSNSDYVYDKDAAYNSKIISTNACSEQYLSRESLCVLSSINVGRFSIDENSYKQELEKVGTSINRFLDNVNECELVYNTYATPHQKLAIEHLRRTGAGSTNWEAWFLKNKVLYGSDKANTLAQKFNEYYNYFLYKNSIELGKEKGNFKLFNKEKLEQSPFIKHMMSLGLEFNTLRNVTCSSIAPTGTLALMFRGLVMSYGVEPAFGLYYWKRTRISGQYEYYFNVPRVVREMFDTANLPIPMESDTFKDDWAGSKGSPIVTYINDNLNKIGIVYKDATDIDPLCKLKFMSELMKDCDSSISTTYLLPIQSTWQDVYDFILKSYESEVKSIAAFPDKKMYGIISYIPFKDLAFKLKEEKVEIHIQNFTEQEANELDIHGTIKAATNAPKRPLELPADIYTTIVNKEKFVVVVGLLNNTPYEIFCGESNGLNFKFKEKKGSIVKVKRGHYKLVIGEDLEIENFSEHFKETEKALFRMVSTSLRHGVPIKFIVEQLIKSVDNLATLTNAAAKVLKKYIKNGEIVTGHSCPTCGSKELTYADGCVSCNSCNWSKC